MGYRIAERAVLACALIAMSASAARPARVEPAPLDVTLAQSLFDEGRALLEGGKTEEACDRFAKSQKLAPSGGTLLNLALCHERLGKVATAWSEFNEAYGVAMRDGRQDRSSFAKEMVEKLRPRLPRLVVTLASGNPAAVEVRIDGAKVPAEGLGVETPIDPGEHVIDAVGPGHSSWNGKTSLAEGEQKRLEIPILVPSVSCPQGSVLTGDKCVKKAEDSRLSTASWVFGGASVVSLVGAGVTGVLAVTSRQEVLENCNLDRHFCGNESAKNAASRATALAWVSTATLGVGVIGLATAYFLPRAKGARTEVSLSLGPEAARLRVDF